MNFIFNFYFWSLFYLVILEVWAWVKHLLWNNNWWVHCTRPCQQIWCGLGSDWGTATLCVWTPWYLKTLLASLTSPLVAPAATKTASTFSLDDFLNNHPILCRPQISTLWLLLVFMASCLLVLIVPIDFHFILFSFSFFLNEIFLYFSYTLHLLICSFLGCSVSFGSNIFFIFNLND